MPHFIRDESEEDRRSGARCDSLRIAHSEPSLILTVLELNKTLGNNQKSRWSKMGKRYTKEHD